MLSLVVRRIVQSGYAKQNRGDFAALSKMFSHDAVFEFQGNTSFGGERRGRAAIRAWFDQGFQCLRIARGKVKEDRILVDLGVVENALEMIERWKSRGAEPPAKSAV